MIKLTASSPVKTLCLIRRDFESHKTPTGRCGNSECSIEVKPDDPPWDERNIDECADAMLARAVALGLVLKQ